MADDVASSGESGSEQGPPPRRTPGTLEVLQRLSLRTKALVISSEYTRRQMEPADLRRVLEALAPTRDERMKAVRAVEEELRAARYPMGEIVRLVDGLTSESDESAQPVPPQAAHQGGAARRPRDPNVVVTRKVRSPNLMPFEKFEFGSPGRHDKTADTSPSGEGPSEPRLKFVSGGESAPFSAKESAEGKKGLAGMGARFAARPEGAPAGRTSGAGGPTVLVADDDGRARMMYRAKLEESGFTVVEAKDGIEAWNVIRGGGVQCAVMDMKMPGYHGLEILGRMVDADSIIPVVVVSAFDQLANEFVVATYPKLKFLAKPAPPEDVVDAVNFFLKPGKRVET